MMLTVAIVVSQFIVAGVFGLSTNNVTVGELGNVIGLKEFTKWTNRTIYSFRGIPYAEPPIGDLRFRPPVKKNSWNGTLNGQEFGNICPQNAETGLSGNNEDCLTLNVYVPEIDNENVNLPVMIWIHGGTFMTGYASIYQPHFLLEEDVILVVPQFRLGPLGLLCLQTDEIPGNVQFLDQIMAMKWVQDNIRYFGGNPNEVTLFGQSSGAASVNLHQFSPLSNGLFHRAIIHSGSALAPWVMDYNPLKTAANLGIAVGCNNASNLTVLAACYKSLDVQTLLDGFDNYIAAYTLQGLAAFGGHRAVIQTAGTQKFLEEDPATLLANFKYNQMPIIGGATKHDGSFALASYYLTYFNPLGLTTDKEYLQHNMTAFITTSFGMNDQSGGIAQTLMTAHYAKEDIGDFSKMVPGIIDICSVLSFKAPVLKMLQANSRVNTTWLYRFGYFGENSVLSDVQNLSFKTGIAHTDDLIYLFPLFENLSKDDLIVAKRMVSLWTSFAKTGQPTTDGKTWEPMNNAFGPYLIIDEEFFDGTNYLTEHTIALREGMTAVDRSFALNITPQLGIVFATTLSLVFRL